MAAMRAKARYAESRRSADVFPDLRGAGTLDAGAGLLWEGL